ncbi:hypothetical protein [Anabaena sp. CCY 9402-a]|uniref:hypothetical protein n=1 Tax=Anabaena sp. CCY 9402-a TaxID=3103867 RepID=UPI0039C6BB8D
MARRVVVAAEPQPVVVEAKTFEVQYDDEAGTVSFNLSDGTPVILEKPKTRQMLLIESWLSSVEPEYKTSAFTTLKLASLCTIKYGEATKISFDKIIDIDFEDCERVVKALECFRDFFEHMAKRATGNSGAKPASNNP